MRTSDTASAVPGPTTTNDRSTASENVHPVPRCQRHTLELTSRSLPTLRLLRSSASVVNCRISAAGYP